MALLVLLTGCLIFKGVRECFAFAEGSACGWGKTKPACRTGRCAICGLAMKIQNILCGGKKIKTQKGRQ
jgi:hypothetical protein